MEVSSTFTSIVWKLGSNTQVQVPAICRSRFTPVSLCTQQARTTPAHRCGYEFQFRSLYDEDAPQSLPFLLWVSGLASFVVEGLPVLLRACILAMVWLVLVPLIFAWLHRSFMHWSTPWNREYVTWTQFVQDPVPLALDWLCGAAVLLSSIIAAQVSSAVLMESMRRATQVRLSISRLHAASSGMRGWWHGDMEQPVDPEPLPEIDAVPLPPGDAGDPIGAAWAAGEEGAAPIGEGLQGNDLDDVGGGVQDGGMQVGAEWERQQDEAMAAAAAAQEEAWDEDALQGEGPGLWEFLGVVGDPFVAAVNVCSAVFGLVLLMAAFVFLPGTIGRGTLAALRHKSIWPLWWTPEVVWWSRGLANGIPLPQHGLWTQQHALLSLGTGAPHSPAAAHPVSHLAWLAPAGILSSHAQVPHMTDRVWEWPLTADDTYEVLLGYVVFVLLISFAAAADEVSRWLLLLWRRVRAVQRRGAQGAWVLCGRWAGRDPASREVERYAVDGEWMFFGALSSSSHMTASVMVFAKICIVFLTRIMLQPAIIGCVCDLLLQPLLGQMYSHVIAEMMDGAFIGTLYRWALGMFVMLIGVTILLTVRDLLHPSLAARFLRAFNPTEQVFEPMARLDMSTQCYSALNTTAFLIVMMCMCLVVPLWLTGQSILSPATDSPLAVQHSEMWRQLHPNATEWPQAQAWAAHLPNTTGMGWNCSRLWGDTRRLLPPRLTHAVAGALSSDCGGVLDVADGLNVGHLKVSPAQQMLLVGGSGPALQYMAAITPLSERAGGRPADADLVRVVLRVHRGDVGGASPGMLGERDRGQDVPTAADGDMLAPLLLRTSTKNLPLGPAGRFLTATDRAHWHAFSPWLCLGGLETNSSQPQLRLCPSLPGVGPPSAPGMSAVPVAALQSANLTRLLGIFPPPSTSVVRSPQAEAASAAHVGAGGEVHTTAAEADPQVGKFNGSTSRSVQLAFMSNMMLPGADVGYHTPLGRLPAAAQASTQRLLLQLSRLPTPSHATVPSTKSLDVYVKDSSLANVGEGGGSGRSKVPLLAEEAIASLEQLSTDADEAGLTALVADLQALHAALGATHRRWSASAGQVPLTLGDVVDVATRVQHAAPVLGSVWHSLRVYRDVLVRSGAGATEGNSAQEQGHLSQPGRNESNSSFVGSIFSTAVRSLAMFTAPLESAVNSTLDRPFKFLVDSAMASEPHADTLAEASRWHLDNASAAAKPLRARGAVLLNATVPLGSAWAGIELALRRALAFCGTRPSDACIESLLTKANVTSPSHAGPSQRPHAVFRVVGSVWGQFPPGHLPYVSSTRVKHLHPSNTVGWTGPADRNPFVAKAWWNWIWPWLGQVPTMYLNTTRSLHTQTRQGCRWAAKEAGLPATGCDWAASALAWAVWPLAGIPLTSLRLAARLVLAHTPRPLLFVAAYHYLPLHKIADLLVAEVGLTLLMEPFRTLLWWWAVLWITTVAKALGLTEWVMPIPDQVHILRRSSTPDRARSATQPLEGGDPPPAWLHAVLSGYELPALSLPRRQLQALARAEARQATPRASRCAIIAERDGDRDEGTPHQVVEGALHAPDMVVSHRMSLHFLHIPDGSRLVGLGIPSPSVPSFVKWSEACFFVSAGDVDVLDYLKQLQEDSLRTEAVAAQVMEVAEAEEARATFRRFTLGGTIWEPQHMARARQRRRLRQAMIRESVLDAFPQDEQPEAGEVHMARVRRGLRALDATRVGSCLRGGHSRVAHLVESGVQPQLRSQADASAPELRVLPDELRFSRVSVHPRYVEGPHDEIENASSRVQQALALLDKASVLLIRLPLLAALALGMLWIGVLWLLNTCFALGRVGFIIMDIPPQYLHDPYSVFFGGFILFSLLEWAFLGVLGCVNVLGSLVRVLSFDALRGYTGLQGAATRLGALAVSSFLTKVHWLAVTVTAAFRGDVRVPRVTSCGRLVRTVGVVLILLICVPWSLGDFFITLRDPLRMGVPGHADQVACTLEGVGHLFQQAQADLDTAHSICSAGRASDGEVLPTHNLSTTCSSRMADQVWIASHFAEGWAVGEPAEEQSQLPTILQKLDALHAAPSLQEWLLAVDQTLDALVATIRHALHSSPRLLSLPGLHAQLHYSAATGVSPWVVKVSPNATRDGILKRQQAWAARQQQELHASLRACRSRNDSATRADRDWLGETVSVVTGGLTDLQSVGLSLILSGGSRGAWLLWIVGVTALAIANQGMWMGCCGPRGQGTPQRIANAVLRGRSLYLLHTVLVPTVTALSLGHLLLAGTTAAFRFWAKPVFLEPDLGAWCRFAMHEDFWQNASTSHSVLAAGVGTFPQAPSVAARFGGATRHDPQNLPLTPGMHLPQAVLSPLAARGGNVWDTSTLVPHVISTAIDPATPVPDMPLMDVLAPGLPRGLWPHPLSGRAEHAWGAALRNVSAHPAAVAALCFSHWNHALSWKDAAGGTQVQSGVWLDPIEAVLLARRAYAWWPAVALLAVILVSIISPFITHLHKVLYDRQYTRQRQLLELHESQRQAPATFDEHG